MTTKLSILLLSGCLTFSPAALTQQLLDYIVAIVDDSVILNSELEQRTQTVKQSLKGQTPNENILKEQVLERLVIESIQLQMAERGGIRISDGLLNQTVERIAKQNNMTLQEFRSNLQKDGVDYQSAREQIRKEIIISQVHRQRVGARITVSEKEVDTFLSSNLGKSQTATEYELGHILVALPSKPSPEDVRKAEKKASQLFKQLSSGADFAKTAVSHSDSPSALEGGSLGWRKELELPSLFADVVPQLRRNQVAEPIRNSSGFHIVKVLNKRGGGEVMVPQYQVRHILVKPNEIRDEQQSEALIKKLKSRLVDGEPFQALATEFSDDPGSSVSGGDLGWVSPGEMVPAFEAVMTRIPKGNTSQPFLSQFGWHILEVMDTRQQDLGQEMQRKQAKMFIFNRKFEEELPIWVSEIRAEAFVEIKEP